MKKTILVILAAMFAISSVFATVHAGTDFDLSVRVDSSQLDGGPDFLYGPQVRFIAKPYYSNEKVDVGLRFKFGYDCANFLTYFFEEEETAFPVYSFLTTIRAYDIAFDGLSSELGPYASLLKYSFIAAEFIDHITFNGNWLTLSLNREKEMEVSTLATGKYVKESILNIIAESEGVEEIGEITSFTDMTTLLDPNLSLTLSAKHGDFSFFSFIDNVGDVGGLVFNAAGVEVKFASALKDGLKYKASVLAQGMPIVSDFAIIPDFAVSYETTNGDTPVTYTAEVNAVVNPIPAGFAAQFSSSKKFGKIVLDSDVYVVKEFTSASDFPVFRNTYLGTDYEYDGFDAYAIGADLTATLNFNSNGKMYLGTGFGIKAGFGVPTTYITMYDDDECWAGNLDYLKVGLTFGDTAWFGIDAEMDYFYTRLLSRLEGDLIPIEGVNPFNMGITTGKKFNNGSWELKLNTVNGTEVSGPFMFDVVGSFKMTYKLGN